MKIEKTDGARREIFTDKDFPDSLSMRVQILMRRIEIDIRFVPLAIIRDD